MAFKQVADLECDSATALGGVDKKTGKQNPKTIEGYFIGTRQVDSPKSKTGKAALHVVQTQNGNVGVWGKTNLDQKMKAVPAGHMVRITFTGMRPTKNNPMYTYSVEIDADQTIEVSSASAESEGDSSESSSYDDINESDPLADEAQEEAVPYRATPAKQPAQPATAARQKQVQDLLRGRKTG